MAGELSADATAASQAAPRRKFAIQPVETTSRSSKAERGEKKVKEIENNPEQENEKPRRQFLPQPVEETSRSSRRGGTTATSAQQESNANRKDEPATKPNGNTERKPRKFAVEPVETVKRVRRRNTGPALQPGDGTDESPADRAAKPSLLDLPVAPPAPMNSPNIYDEALPPSLQPGESRFSYAALTRKMSRQSSMRKPTLEPISSVPESEESNFSKRSSQSSRSSLNEDDHQTLRYPRKKRQPRQKESYEEGFSGYLLDIAAKAAQQQLREQVAEAYPNERLYEPVDHFAVDRESDSDVEAVGQLPDIKHEDFSDRRESSAGWNAEEIQKHRDKLEQQKEQQKQEDIHQDKKPNERPRLDQRDSANRMQLPKPDPTRISPATPKKDPFGNPFNLSAIGGEGARDPELSRMQDKARPPMLGGSMVFMRCQSPRQTLIDPLQRHGTRRNTGLASRDESGLWSPGGPCSPLFNPNKGVMQSPRASVMQSPRASVCLWGGSCTADQAAMMKVQFPTHMQTGIMTPQYAPDEDPFERYANDESLQNAQTAYHQMQQQTILPQQAARNQHQLPANPGSRVTSILGIDQLLAVEQRIEQEYPDAFVSQIYNYLSLGYPAIARSYDEELSRISKVSVEDIRRHDERKNTKGYVGAPEGNGISETNVKEECGRWRALRLYIHEWARQQPYMMDDGADATWGARARRGSWFA